MNESDELLKKRLTELAGRAYDTGIYTFTQFLDMNGLSVYGQLRRALSFVPAADCGGADACERRMVRFGSVELCGYEADFPIVCLSISPKNGRFADALSHRDFLGALMNLGVKRETLGDIFVSDNTGYLFCTDAVAPYITENLTKVCHTDVVCAETDALPAQAAPKLNARTVQLSGERLDALIAKCCNISREDSAELFRQGRVFVNSAPVENLSRCPVPGDVISVRGRGRFIYRGVTGTSKKGKLIVTVEEYGD